MRESILIMSVLFLFAGNLLAQERIVSGSVTASEDGTPLPGVNVVIKGTTNGTVTSLDSSYKLIIPEEGGIHIFIHWPYITGYRNWQHDSNRYCYGV